MAYKAACELLYATLALCTTGRAKLIVKETMSTRNGAEAWARLRERCSKTTGATSYAEIFKHNWTSSKSFEDKWREWVEKMSRLPGGSLGDAAKEALVIEGVNQANHRALEQHLRLKSPQVWREQTKTVDAYLSTMCAGDGSPTPMEIGAVRSQGTCLCCGRQGHIRQTCKFKDQECRNCGKKGHLAAVCRSGKGKGIGKSSGKGKGQGLDKSCLCCGKKGHMKSECRFKEEKCLVCGKVGHLKAVCRSKGGNEVTEQARTSETGSSAPSSVLRAWAWSVEDDNEKEHVYKVQAAHGRNGTFVSTWLLDTGADVHVMTEAEWRRMGCPALQKTTTKLNTTSGEDLDVLGQVRVQFELQGYIIELDAIVSSKAKRCLLSGIRLRDANFKLVLEGDQSYVEKGMEEFFCAAKEREMLWTSQHKGLGW